ncbi:MAG: hydantoinase/oxoprolinase N-terminal domain-containing protein, partial [Pseudomonadota bacterium]
MAIDIGGTFTDTVLMDGAAQILATTKTPTTPEQPTIGALEGARRVLRDAGAAWSNVV